MKIVTNIIEINMEIGGDKLFFLVSVKGQSPHTTETNQYPRGKNVLQASLLREFTRKTGTTSKTLQDIIKSRPKLAKR